MCDLPTGSITVDIDHTFLEPDTLFDFAARENSARGFLFMSKVLGKHFPSKPQIMRRVHEILSSQISKTICDPVVFIAMAETAVGLGHGVYESFQSANPYKACLFLHTTRYRLPHTGLIEFQESHSHAPNQFLHFPMSDQDMNILKNAKSLVLIDDEATTGNTFLNLVNSLRGICNLLEEVHLSVITNFMGRNASCKEFLSNRFNIKTSLGCVLTGSYQFRPNNLDFNKANAQNCNLNLSPNISPLFGRTGLSKRISIKDTFISQLEKNIDAGDKILVVGTGEFMHIPFLIGAELDRRGHEVYIQSSTRSPIIQWGGIKKKLVFKDNYNEGIDNYLYNVAKQQYNKIYIFHETELNDSLTQFAELVNAELFYISGNEIEFSHFY